MNSNIKTKRIYKRSMAEYLVDNGCTLVRVTTDVVNSQRQNWLFEDNDKLREGMTAYTQQLHS